MTPSGAEISPAGRSCRWRRSEIQILCVQRRRDLERKQVPGEKMVYSSNASLHGLRLRQGISASLAIPTYAPLHPELAHILLSVCRSISSGVTRFVFLTNFHTKMLNRYTTMPI